MSKKRTVLTILGAACLVVIFFIIRYFLQTPCIIQDDDETYTPEPLTKYGIPVDSLILYEGVVLPRETLSDILGRYNVSSADIYKLAEKADGVFNLRRIKAGQNFSVLCLNDSMQTVKYFIYEESPTSFVVFNLGDTINVYTAEREIERRIKISDGTIESSLWNAMISNGDDPQLALELSNIYAWTIDFFGIQRGDSYKVMFEELYVEGQRIGIGKIFTSVFRHLNNDYYAFYYEQDDDGDYFDEQANSLRKSFLKAPLQYSRISSHFSHRRLHPVHRVYRPHHGVDYAAPTGTPVMAIGDGKVTFARYKGAAGNMVEIVHNSVYKTQYLHLSKYGKGIREGVRVKQGQVIGYVGSTGTSTGPHLDFRVYENGKPVNPLTVKSPPAEPIKPEYKDDYLNHADSLKHLLQEIVEI
ncbi:MAG: peptidoglycan DD-metalloendopeptidase family protein [Bacteroidales bacterium]|jgi:murein DD-endopeptidase MepM/ murein hydrolase activator NlpD|nr:peptidoglycan DD-metalloendopeptidase family protein [Bacteroidales bacterium]